MRAKYLIWVKKRNIEGNYVLHLGMQDFLGQPNDPKPNLILVA